MTIRSPGNVFKNVPQTQMITLSPQVPIVSLVSSDKHITCPNLYFGCPGLS